MAKIRTSPVPPVPGKPRGKSPKRVAPANSKAGSYALAVRETIESVAIAFILAFLFRTFQAEAFVIPTGSMAPTLMGRHKDVICDQCDASFQANASDEMDPDGRRQPPGKDTVEAICPICRHPMPLEPASKYPSYSGDRILVDKFAYQWGDPKRWDIAVFKCPVDAPQNYIKRLVGMPNETLRVAGGDTFVMRDGEDDFEIVRKPPDKQLAMLQLVYDNDFAPKLEQLHWPPRWEDLPIHKPDGTQKGGWQAVDKGKGFRSPEAGEAWLGYRHRVPTPQQWREHPRRADLDIKPQLIRDFTAYNTAVPREQSGRTLPDHWGTTNWVGDLALQCRVKSGSDRGYVILELVKGDRTFRCTLNLEDGTATLGISGADMRQWQPTASTKLVGRGEHRVMFANCDAQLRLWVDGRLVRFGADDATTYYPPLGNYSPTSADLQPARIGVLDAEVTVSGIVLKRDIYYLATEHMQELVSDDPWPHGDPERATGRWGGLFSRTYTLTFHLDADQYLALGDNSDRSRDSRWWDKTDRHEFFVRREFLVGKALFIYWPHSWNWPIPFFPNFGRMHFVR